jgi:MYXO-CTERM domain-containing protein
MNTTMNTSTRMAILGIGPLAIVMGLAGDARANYLEHCNGIVLEADAAASCKVVATEECSVNCVPVAMEKVCASRLTASCTGNCTAAATVECRSGCETTCVPECTTQETGGQPPNCMGLCMSDCQQDCNVTCVGGACRSQCAQICSTDCRDKCAAAPEPVCEPVCTTACEGSCEGRANVDCQVSCQATTFTTCETDIAQECTTDCESTGRAIFCDGQFLASASELEACASDIEAEFSITLDISVAADASIESKGIGCSIGPNSNHSRSGFGLMSLFGLGALSLIRRRRQATRRP